MIRLSGEAQRQLLALLEHYERLGRTQAGRNLLSALDQAVQAITTNLDAGLPAPRPYPVLARPGRLWTKAGRYWIAYTTTPPLIVAVFHDTADITGRL